MLKGRKTTKNSDVSMPESMDVYLFYSSTFCAVPQYAADILRTFVEYSFFWIWLIHMAQVLPEFRSVGFWFFTMLNISFALSLDSINCSTFPVHTYILTPKHTGYNILSRWGYDNLRK